MRELKEDTFSGNKDEDAHDHIDWVLNIVGLFNILGVSKDAVMHRVFPFTLMEPQKDGWTDSPQELSIYGISSKRPLSKGIAHLPRPQSSLKISITLSKKETNHYTRPKSGTIPRMTPAQALTAIQTMIGHSQKWHDGTTSKNIGSSSSNVGLAALTDNHPPYGERRQSLEELLAKHQEESARRTPLGIVENVLVKIDKFLFPSDFVIIDNTPSETTILRRPFLATIHAKIDVFAENFSLGINEDRIIFDTMRKDHNYTNPSEKHFMVNSGLINRPQSPAQSNNQIYYEESDDSAIVDNPNHRSFDDYKWEFNLEIDKLADEYELRIGKKGHILDNIWEYCNQVHNKNYGWHNHEFENEECEEIGIENKDYHPPEVQVETFEVKKYSFEGRQSFVCVIKDLDNVLPLGRKNGSKFKEMIRKEVENNKT
ncbi:hypothetical protein Tco_1153449 [Tanacetum coccineum]